MFEETNQNQEELNQEDLGQEQGTVDWGQESVEEPMEGGTDLTQEGQVFVETPVPEVVGEAVAQNPDEGQVEPDALDALMDGEDYVPDAGEEIQPEVESADVQEPVGEQPVEQMPEGFAPVDPEQEQEEAAHQELISGPVKRSGPQTTEEKGQTQRRNTRRQRTQDSGSQIWYINPQDRFDPTLDENEKARVDIISARLSKERLVGTITHIEPPQKLQEAHAYITHGSYTVVIPANRIIPPRKDYGGEDPARYRARQLNLRIGSEIEYLIVGEIDHKNHLAAGDRLKAMEQKCAQQWLRTDTQGQYILDEGSLIEVRVVVVYRNGIIVEAFGLESFIGRSQLSYGRIADARQEFSVGTKITAKVIQVDRADPENIQIELSIKQVNSDTKSDKISQYKGGNRCVGVVSNIIDSGVFVTLKDGVDCLCSYPPHFRPIVGSDVVVRIRNVDVDKGRVWGRIEV